MAAPVCCSGDGGVFFRGSHCCTLVPLLLSAQECIYCRATSGLINGGGSFREKKSLSPSVVVQFVTILFFTHINCFVWVKLVILVLKLVSKF